jgi:hypothetical protein
MIALLLAMCLNCCLRSCPLVQVLLLLPLLLLLAGLQAHVRQLMVDGRAVGADEAAVCDLCDSDDEPSWQVQKKQAVDLGPEEL